LQDIFGEVAEEKNVTTTTKKIKEGKKVKVRTIDIIIRYILALIN